MSPKDSLFHFPDREPIATVTSADGVRKTNSLEFNDSSFIPIDSDDTGMPHSTAFDTTELVGAAVDVWKRQTFDRDYLEIDRTPSPRKKSPPPVVLDRRLRHTESSHSAERISIPDKRVIKRTPSDPREMEAFVAEFAGTGPNRAMWSKMPQVISAGLLKDLSTIQKKQQEALFEIITSEASYYRSLNVLIEVFYKSPSMQPGSTGAVVSHTQKHHLYSNILDIHATSENLLCAMEACFREDPWLTRLCEIVYEHTEERFDTYITYMQNQMYQHRVLEKLQSNPAFELAVKQLQTQPECAFLNLSSFLILPTQRVTRLCLLVSTVLNYAPRNTTVYRSGLVALAALDKCIREGEAKKLNMEQKERLMNLTQQFEYKFDAKSLSTENRRLIKEGELGLITVAQTAGSAFRRKFSGIMRQKTVLASLFLFNDLLVIAKKRGNNRLTVDEYSPLADVKVEILDTPPEAIILRHFETIRNTECQENRLSDQRVSSRKAIVSEISTESSCLAYYPFRIIIQSESHPRAEYTLQAKSL